MSSPYSVSLCRRLVFAHSPCVLLFLGPHVSMQHSCRVFSSERCQGLSAELPLEREISPSKTERDRQSRQHREEIRNTHPQSWAGLFISPSLHSPLQSPSLPPAISCLLRVAWPPIIVVWGCLLSFLFVLNGGYWR